MVKIDWVGKEKIKEIIQSIHSAPIQFTKEDKKVKLIGGDNLLSLLSLRSTYKGKIQSVITDPPYNTGYGDDMQYSDNIDDNVSRDPVFNKLSAYMNQMDSSEKWLTMIYSRLLIVKDLLSEDGLVFIIISSAEEGNLRLLLDDVFGSENYINTIIWQKRNVDRDDTKFFSESHNSILCYGKNKMFSKIRKIKNNGPDRKKYVNLDGDIRGDWTLYDLCTERFESNRVHRYSIKTPSGRVYRNPEGGSWNITKDQFEKLCDENRVWFGERNEEFPLLKIYKTEYNGFVAPGTLWLSSEVGNTSEAKDDLQRVFPNEKLPFFTPKPIRLIKRLIEISSDSNSMVLDIFSGSGTLGQAILELNKENADSKRYAVLLEIEEEVINIIRSRMNRVSDNQIEYIELMNLNTIVN